jgi:hypothetical protein
MATCCECHKEIAPPPQGSITTGYGINEKGQPVCYACCAVQDHKWMDETGKRDLYLTGLQFYAEGKGLQSACEVTNWPGSLRFSAHVHKGRHNWAGVVYNVWFLDNHGREWYGRTVGNNTQICHCRRRKSK